MIMSNSLDTPPLSPASEFIKERQQLSSNKFNISSFLCRKTSSKLCPTYLTSLLEGHQQLGGDFTNFSLFGKSFHISNFLLLHNQQHFFSLTKKRLYILKHSAIKGKKGYDISKLELYRQEICEFLSFLKAWLHHLCVRSLLTTTLNELLKKSLAELVKDLKCLLLFCGNLSSIPDAVYLTGASGHSSQNINACYIYYHTCLDIWWSCLEILHSLYSLSRNNSLDVNLHVCVDIVQDPKNYFSQTISLVIFDLCVLAFQRFKGPEFSYVSTSPFLCPCIKELWTLLIVLLDKRQNLFHENSICFYLNLVHQYLMQDMDSSATVDTSGEIFLLQKTALCTAPHSEFCLWLAMNVIKLYRCDGVVMSNIDKEPENSTVLVKSLLEQILRSEYSTKSEKCLRNILPLFQNLPDGWKLIGDVLLIFTDFYVKNIDCKFGMPSVDLSNLSCLFKTSKDWCDFLLSITQNNVSGLNNENSFYLYLRLLFSHLEETGLQGSFWRQLKGRIFSKFTPKRLKELSENGLQNCFCMLLIVFYTTSLEDIASKICDITLMTRAVPGDVKRQLVAWKALCVILLMYQKQGKNLDAVAPKAVQIFNSLCSDYSQALRDSMRKTNLMNLILVYISAVQNIFEHSSLLNLSEYVLIGSGFSNLLSSCGTELSYILNIVQCILSRFCSISESVNETNNHYKTDYELLLKGLLINVYPFVEQHVLTNTPPVELAKIAALFTFLLYKYSGSSVISNHSFVGLFQYYCNGNAANASITCSYLNTVLQNSLLVSDLKKSLASFNALVVQSWLLCCISIVPPNNEVSELSQLALNCDLKRQFPGVNQISLSEKHDVICIKFFQVLEETYKQCNSFHERNYLKENIHLYFKSTPDVIRNKMQKYGSNDFLKYIYRMMSNLVYFAGSLLYSKYKSDTVLPQLIEILLFPNRTFKDKFLPSTLSSFIKETLPFFIKGLSKLDMKTDQYVKRQMKDIVVHYLCVLPVGGNNPIVQVTVESVVQHESCLTKDFFLLVLDILKEEFFVSASPNSLHGFQFCTEIFKRVPSLGRKDICESLLSFLLQSLLNSEGSFHHSCKELIQIMFVFLKGTGEYGKRFIVSACETLIKGKLAWSQFKVFRVLEFVSSQFPSSMPEVVSFLSTYIEYVEHKRGCGKDATLRRELKELSDKVKRF